MRDAGVQPSRARLEPDESDRDRQTLLFWYPGVTGETIGYIRSAQAMMSRMVSNRHARGPGACTRRVAIAARA